MCLSVLALTSAAGAVPAAYIAPGSLTVTASAHSIGRGADAASRIFELDYGINPNLGFSGEFAKVDDESGRTEINSILLTRPVPMKSSVGLRFSGYVGVTRLSVEDLADETSSSTGLTLGMAGSYPLRSDLSLYSRVGVAFLDSSLWTFDAGVNYEVRPNWDLSLGYRGYDIGGEAMGGFLAGAVYHFPK